MNMSKQEAQEITDRIRTWVEGRPVDDIIDAYERRAWDAMGYQSWSDWCEFEFGGFRFSAPARKAVVADLHERGMSNRGIGEVVGSDERTVRRDLSGAANAAPGPRLGQDGKSYPAPKPKQRKPSDEPIKPFAVPPNVVAAQEKSSPVIDALAAEMPMLQVLSDFDALCDAVKEAAKAVEEAGPIGEPVWVERLNESSAKLTDAQVYIMQAVVERAQS